MIRLVALRHAKSSWAVPGLSDFQRPLNARGLKDAPRMGEWLFTRGEYPEHILCSPSLRTRETYRLFCKAYGEALACELVEDLYLPAPETILSTLRHLPAVVKTAMIIAHNPGLHEAVVDFLTPAAKAEARYLVARYPTSAIAIIEFPFDQWANLDWSTGTLNTYMEPKKLPQTGEGIITA